MEAVYFYEKKTEKDVLNILKNDEFMRISHIIRDSDVLHDGKKGYIIYVKASQEEADSMAQKFKDIGVERIAGEEEKAIIDTFKAEEDNAACGIGLIFG
jgi:hypothetical protein